MTISPEYMDYVDNNQALSKEKPRHFIEALRLKYRGKIKFKHFIASEYGDHTNRPHFHALLFATLEGQHSAADVIRSKQDVTDFICKEKSTAWPYGFILSKPCHKNVFAYITNYINKPELVDPETPHPVRPFTCISQGIGLQFLERIDLKQFSDLDFVVGYNGSKQVLPRYYREKLFPHSETDDHYHAAVLAGDREYLDKIHENRRAWITKNNSVAVVRQKGYERKQREFERTHSIEYREYLQHVAAEEQRQYNNKLLQRKSL